jgi:hypothetical protein
LSTEKAEQNPGKQRPLSSRAETWPQLERATDETNFSSFCLSRRIFQLLSVQIHNFSPMVNVAHKQNGKACVIETLGCPSLTLERHPSDALSKLRESWPICRLSVLLIIQRWTCLAADGVYGRHFTLWSAEKTILGPIKVRAREWAYRMGAPEKNHLLDPPIHDKTASKAFRL